MGNKPQKIKYCTAREFLNRINGHFKKDELKKNIAFKINDENIITIHKFGYRLQKISLSKKEKYFFPLGKFNSLFTSEYNYYEELKLNDSIILYKNKIKFNSEEFYPEMIDLSEEKCYFYRDKFSFKIINETCSDKNSVFPKEWLDGDIYRISTLNLVFANVFKNRKIYILGKNYSKQKLLIFIKDGIVNFFETELIYIDTFDLVMKFENRKIHINSENYFLFHQI